MIALFQEEKVLANLTPPLKKNISSKTFTLITTSLNLHLPKLYSLQLPEQLPILMDPVKDSGWHLA
jgi:hypothetical protein